METEKDTGVSPGRHESKLLKLSDEQKKMLRELHEREERKRIQREIDEKIRKLSQERETVERERGKRNDDPWSSSSLEDLLEMKKAPSSRREVAQPKNGIGAKLLRLTMTGGRRWTTLMPDRGMTVKQFIAFFLFWFVLVSFSVVMVFIAGAYIGYLTIGK